MAWRAIRFIALSAFVIGGCFLPLPARTEVYNGQEYNFDNIRGRVFNSQNVVSLKLTYKDQQLDGIRAYQHLGKLFIPLGKLVDDLGFKINVDGSAGMAQGWYLSYNNMFVLDVNRREVITKGKGGTIPKDLVYILGNEIYVDISVFNTLFPITLQFDQSKLTLAVTSKQDIPYLDWMIAPENEKTAEAKRPPPGISFEQQSKAVDETKVNTTTTVDNTPSGKTAGAKSAPPTAEIPGPGTTITPVKLSDDNLLILKVALDNLKFDDLLEAYSSDNRTMIPIEQLFTLLEFNITINAAEGTAHGWFIKEANTFDLDSKNGVVTIAGKSTRFNPGLVQTSGGNIYVDARLLSQWLPLTADIDTSQMMLVITPHEPFPAQARLARQQKHADLEKIKNSQAKDNYPKVVADYKALSLPYSDVALGYNYDTNTHKSRVDYSASSSNDLAYMNVQTFMSGNDEEELTNFRVKAERKDLDANLLGPLHASEVTVGDINSKAMPLTAASTLGRGVAISNVPQDVNSRFDVIDLIGDATPDWQVELYRNDVLVDFQTIGNDGRYNFPSVPLFFGNNTFRLVFYGPQGQIREEVKSVRADSSVLKKGDSFYNISVDDKAEEFLGLGTPVDTKMGQGLRMVSNYQYGITDKFSAVVAAVTNPLKDDRHDYLSTGFRAAIDQALTSLDFAYDESNNSWATKASLLTAVQNVNVKLDQINFSDDFVSEDLNKEGNLLSVTELNLNRTIAVPILNTLFAEIDAKYEDFSDLGDALTFTQKLGSSYRGINFSHALSATLTDNQEDQYHGSLVFNGIIDKNSIRNTIDYTISPTTELQAIFTQIQRRLSEKILGTFELKKDFIGEKLFTFTNGLTYNATKYRLTSLLSVNDHPDVFLGLRLSFGLYKDPVSHDWQTSDIDMSPKGSVVARSFVDKNNNGKSDTDEEPVDKATYVIAGSKFQTGDTPEATAPLPSQSFVNVTLDTSSLEEPLWIPATEGYSIFSHPGSVVRLDFPLVPTSEIDGVVSMAEKATNVQGDKAADEEQTDQRVFGVVVELVDDKGKVVQSKRTEFDGFFAMSRLMPGNYTLRVSSDSLEKRSLTLRKPIPVHITGESDVISDLSLVLDTKGTSTGNPISDDVPVPLGNIFDEQ